MSPSERNAPHSLLAKTGLNLVAIFDLSALPAEISTHLGEPQVLRPFRQLILIGHAGPGLWQALQTSPFRQLADPVDSYTVDQVERLFAAAAPGSRYEILYPGSGQPPLQRLGELAGWHHPSPFWLGINREWGSWFAYRAVALADCDFPLTAPLAGDSPCDDCRDRPCLAACPIDALNRGSLRVCLDYRLAEESRCREQCPARLACPVGAEHRYSVEQIRYHYRRSLDTIMEHRQ